MKREPTEDATESKTLRMDRHLPHGNRETPETPLPVGGRGRLRKVLDQSPNVYVDGESDDLIVPEKQANKVGPTPAAESVEGRGSTKGNVARQAADRTQSRASASSGLSGVRQAANAYSLLTQGKSRMR
jgi:RNA-directed DNA polymerase